MSIQKVKSSCTGCTVCEKICPVRAIEFKQSEDGFLYPQINENICTECGLCEKRCPALEMNIKQNLKKAYYGCSLDKDIVADSSSGGMFSVLAEKILHNGGVVFGAAYDSKSKEVMYKSTDEVSIAQLRRSKYVESVVGNSFIKAKEYLEQGRIVLFVGMPCHIAGLKKFLNYDYENLITCDFICGGSGSPLFFKEHLNFLENKYKSQVENINFRPKLFGWKEYAIKIEFKNNKQYRNYAFLDTYFRGFIYEGVVKRGTCAECKFRNNHFSDIILADFWHHKKIEEIKDDDRGLSLLITNSDKGESFIKGIDEDDAVLKEIPLSIVEGNFKPFKNPEIHKKRKNLLVRFYKKYGFEKAAKKLYMKRCYRFKIKKMLKSIIKGL